MGIENLARKGLASKYHMQCVEVSKTILKIEQKQPPDKVDEKNLFKASELVELMIIGDKHIRDIPIGKKIKGDLMSNIQLTGVGYEAIDSLIRDLSYEFYPYHIFLNGSREN